MPGLRRVLELPRPSSLALFTGGKREVPRREVHKQDLEPVVPSTSQTTLTVSYLPPSVLPGRASWCWSRPSCAATGVSAADRPERWHLRLEASPEEVSAAPGRASVQRGPLRVPGARVFGERGSEGAIGKRLLSSVLGTRPK